MKRQALILSLLLGTTALVAQTEQNDLAWMSGHWCGGSTGNVIEEYWMPAHGGVLIGVSRTLKGARTAGFEYMRIENVAGVPTFIAQPNGVPPTSFKRTAGGKDWVRFENPQHDFPKRIEYLRQGANLYAEVSDGKEKAISYDYRPCPRSP